MGYIRDRKKRKKRMRKWVRKFIKWGLIIAFVAFLIWWFLHMLGDFHGTIVGLEDQVNRQNIEINNMNHQLQESLAENNQMQVKINGLNQFIVDQNHTIHDLQDQLNQPIGQFNAPEPRLGNADSYEQPKVYDSQDMTKDMLKHPGALAIPSLIGALGLLGRIALPILKFGGI